MRLKSFEFKGSGLSYERMDFHPWNLIVGGSGTGKTQLLRTIQSVFSTASYNHIRRPRGTWDCVFETIDGVEFKWQGQAKHDLPKALRTLERESLSRDGQEVFTLEDGVLNLKGNISDNPPRAGSVLSTSGVPEIVEASKALAKVTFSEGNRATHQILEPIPEDEVEQTVSSIEELRAKPYSALSKLCKAEGTGFEQLENVKDAFIECFPFVTGMKFFFNRQGDRRFPNFLIEEGGGSIDRTRTSSGMIRALIHLAELHFSEDGTLFLIDEFENSLGANCIDQVTSWLMERRRGCQYIMTSHHPKVISEVPMKYWQILSREGNVVTSKTAEQAGLGSSKHSAFLQLMNLKGFNEGPSN